MIITAPQDVLRSWLTERVGHLPAETLCVGAVKSREIKAVIGYEGFNGASARVHIALADTYSGNRELIEAGFVYPFEVWRLRTLIAPISKNNAASVALAQRLGFKQAALIEDGHKDGDLLIMSMHKKDCRYLRSE